MSTTPPAAALAARPPDRSADRPRGARPDEAAIGRMLYSRRCGALTRAGGLCRAPAVKYKLRCRKHGAAAGVGAPKGNRNARKHGLYAAAEQAEHRRIMAFVRECNRVLDEFDGIVRNRRAARRRRPPDHTGIADRES